MSAGRAASAEPGPLSAVLAWARRILRPGQPAESESPTDHVAIAATPTGQGLWVLNRKGDIFAYGDAPEFREVPQPDPWKGRGFVSMVATPSGRGLWVLSREGDILAYGDAPEFREVPRAE